MARKRPPTKQTGDQKGPRRFNGALQDVAGEARELGITEKQLRSQIARGLIPHRRLGGRIVFLRDEVAAFLSKLPGVSVEQALENIAARQGEGEPAR